MTSFAQNKTIHALRNSIDGFTDADYRAAVGRVKRGAISSKELSAHQAGVLIEELKKLGGKVAPTRRASELVDGPYAPKLRALWIAAWNLGLARSREDKALIAFVKRQTKIEHTRFLTDPGDAMKAIEGLKAWLARDGGVEWPSDREDVVGAKQAVAKAVAKRCFDTGAFTPFILDKPFEREDGRGTWPVDFEAYGYKNGAPAGFEYYEGQHWDHLAARLGHRLRTHLKAKPEKREAA